MPLLWYGGSIRITRFRSAPAGDAKLVRNHLFNDTIVISYVVPRPLGGRRIGTDKHDAEASCEEPPVVTATAGKWCPERTHLAMLRAGADHAVDSGPTLTRCLRLHKVRTVGSGEGRLDGDAPSCARFIPRMMGSAASNLGRTCSSPP